MELQSRSEALAVELARHQNGDLKKQLHERQPRIAALSDKQALGSTTAVPVTGPQVSSLQRLAGQGAAVLPQVRPKTLIPDSLPVTPGRDRPPKQPPTFQKATVVSIKNPSPALPTANNTVNHVPTPSSQTQALTEPTAITSPLSSAGVAYAIISTSPSNAATITPSTTVPVASDGIKVQPLLISADKKVIIIQPQVKTQPESSAEPEPPTEEPSQGAQAKGRSAPQQGES
ncbi:mCG50822 [Mus musculus]|nr:mCG50822 [Mus musculus]